MKKYYLLFFIILLLNVISCGGGGGGESDGILPADVQAINDLGGDDVTTEGSDPGSGGNDPGGGGNPGTPGNDPGSPSVDPSLIAAEYNASTWHLKVFNAKGHGHSNATAIVTDKTGNFIIAGTYSTDSNTGYAIDFDPGEGTDYRQGNGCFITKLNADGSYAWTKTMDAFHITSLATDSKGTIYAVGLFSGNVDFDDAGYDMQVAKGASDFFITRINADGSYGWTKTAGGESDYNYADWARSVAVDSKDNVYMTGYFSGTTDFDCGDGKDIRTSIHNSSYDQGQENCFITRINSDGSYGWTEIFGAVRADQLGATYGYSIALDSKDNVYVGGQFTGEVDLNPGKGLFKRVSNIGLDIFVMKLRADRKFQWAYGMGSVTGHCGTRAICIDNKDNVYAAGFFTGTVDFNDTKGKDVKTSSWNGQWIDSFIMKIGTNGSYRWTRTYDEARILNIACDSKNNIYAGGDYRFDTDFNPGKGVDLIKGATIKSWNLFITKLGPDGSYGRTWAFPATNIIKDIGVDRFNLLNSLHVTGDDTILAAGSFMTEMDFDPDNGGYLRAPAGDDVSFNGFLKRILQ